MQEIAGLKVNDRIRLGAPWNCGATIIGFRYYTSRNNGRTSMVADYLTDTGEQAFDAIERVQQWREDQRQVAEQFEGETALETELLAALRELQKQLHAHIRLDVKKHYSLMVADAAASKAIAKAEG